MDVNDQALKASCHCGQVQLIIERKPDYINNCNCSLCIKSGGVWGYYTTDQVSISGPTHHYKRQDKPTPAVQVHFCSSCGTTTHWHLTEEYKDQADNNKAMGVNMRLFECADLQGTEVRFPDGRRWNGTTPFTYRKASHTLKENDYL